MQIKKKILIEKNILIKVLYGLSYDLFYYDYSYDLSNLKYN